MIFTKIERARFELHVALIQEALRESKAAATFRAYCEGSEGLSRRLAPPQLPAPDPAPDADQ